MSSSPAFSVMTSLDSQRKHEEADGVLRRAIEIQEQAFGPDHPSLGRSLGSRAQVLQAQVTHDPFWACCNVDARIRRVSYLPLWLLDVLLG